MRRRQRRPALAPAVAAQAAARLRIGQEIPVLDAVLVAYQGQGLAFVRDRREPEALGSFAVGALGDDNGNYAGPSVDPRSQS